VRRRSEFGPLSDARVASRFVPREVRVETNHPDVHGVMWRELTAGTDVLLGFLLLDWGSRDDEMLKRVDIQGAYVGCVRYGALHVYEWSGEDHDHYIGDLLSPELTDDDLERATRTVLRERGFLEPSA